MKIKMGAGFIDNTLKLMACFMIFGIPFYVMLSSNATAVTGVIPRSLSHLCEPIQDDLPTVYVITPTYKRYVQILELTRVGQTLLLVPKLHWIVADDAEEENPAVIDLLNSLGISYTYLLSPMPREYKKLSSKPKGVSNRNAAMNWLRKYAREGVFYFADDDNTYDRRLFEEIRYTKKVSMFPVGAVTSWGMSTPIVKDGKFAGWFDGWIIDRKFPVDMAGFAISIPFLLSKPEAIMPYMAGREETGVLESFGITTDDLKFVAENCTKVYAWHTRTQAVPPSSKEILKTKYDNTNLRMLQKTMKVA